MTAMDQPTIDGVNIYFVAREAAARGLKVAMSGLGGDELFGGYDSFRQIPRLVRTLGAVPGVRALGRCLRIVGAPLAARMTSPKIAGLLEYGTRYGDAYLLRRGLFAPWELPRVLDPDLVREGWRRLQPRALLEACHRPVPDAHRKVASLEMTFYMRNQLLRDADWAGMAHSLEIRVPLVDSELLRGLAPAIGGRDRPDKQAMARTPATPLPEAVLRRPKTGFFVPVRDWLHGGAEPVERGLRGWARRVYREATSNPL
jgi:asparagine synthase (glutamine-hydrolysing)